MTTCAARYSRASPLPRLASATRLWLFVDMSALVLTAACCLTQLVGKPIVVDEIQIEGAIHKPTAFTVVSPPASLGLYRAPDPQVVRAAEARLASGPARAADLGMRARARATEARERLEQALHAWDDALACADRGECPAPGDPPIADYRPALVALAEAEGAPDASASEGRIERLALAATLALEPGPGHDEARAMVALDELTRLVPRGPIAIWTRLLMGEHAFDAGDMRLALTHYRAGATSDPASALVPFMRYKSAWAHLNLGEADEAIALFRALASAQPLGPLAREAEMDLVIAYAHRPTRVDEAITVLSSRPRGDRLLLALAESLLDDQERIATARVVSELERHALAADDARRLEDVRARMRR